jgi:hypothetical protein
MVNISQGTPEPTGSHRIDATVNEFRFWLNHPAIDSTDSAYGATYFAYDYDLDGFVDADTFNLFRHKLNTSQDWTF